MRSTHMMETLITIQRALDTAASSISIAPGSEGAAQGSFIGGNAELLSLIDTVRGIINDAAAVQEPEARQVYSDTKKGIVGEFIVPVYPDSGS